MNRFGAIEKPTDILRLELPVDVELSRRDSGGDSAPLDCRTGKAPAPCKGRRRLLLDLNAASSASACRGCSCARAPAGKCSGREKTIDFTRAEGVLKQEAMHDGIAPDLPRLKGPRLYRDTALFRKIKRDTTIVSSSVLCNAVYLFFWSVSDAIAFYRENKDSYLIRFTKKYLYEEERCQNERDAEQPEIHHTPSEDFIKRDADRLRGVWRLVEAGLAPIVHGHANTSGHVHSQFNERVLFFSSMSKLFTPAELKKIESMFRAGKVCAVLSNAKELCVGAQSNIVMQDVLRSLSSEQLLDFIHRLGDDIGPISATKYGAYVVQTVLEMAKCGDMRSVITKYFARYAACLITHPLGNYSIQTVGGFSPEFLRSVLLRNFGDIVKTHIGIRVLKKSLHVFASAKKELLEAIQGCSNPMKCDLLRLVEKQDALFEEGRPFLDCGE